MGTRSVSDVSCEGLTCRNDSRANDDVEDDDDNVSILPKDIQRETNRCLCFYTKSHDLKFLDNIFNSPRAPGIALACEPWNE